jgi:hypothetical protein
MRRYQEQRFAALDTSVGKWESWLEMGCGEAGFYGDD